MMVDGMPSMERYVSLMLGVSLSSLEASSLEATSLEVDMCTSRSGLVGWV